MEEKKELTALFKQGARPAGVEIATARGTFYREVPYPLGDPHNPMTDAHVTKKFMTQAVPVLGRDVAEQVVERALGLEKEASAGPLMALLGGKG
jgi:2-methylcitrate dehydratase PrpD